MSYLVDTSIIVRLANSADARYPTAVKAVLELHRRNEALQITPQVLVEFRNVATRPIAVNGLGLSTTDADRHLATFESRFPLLPETPDLHAAWKAIVQGVAVVGKQVHDARLVAVCHVHNVSHLLTFNHAHFSRMAGFGPGLNVVDAMSFGS